MITNVLNGPLTIEQVIHVKISGEAAGMTWELLVGVDVAPDI